jgi:hypothetical protein
MNVNPEFVATVTSLTAILAVNAAHHVRRRRRQTQAREQARLQLLEDTLRRQLRAEQRRTLDVTLAGEIAALGSAAVWQRFLDLHPELRAGQKGGTS